ncbi:MAG: GAF domain-containing protein, partial [Deltaproteobacteria bacterium]|nr:GAF domain-containing protein [Deltaproteobacteria bacterium]
LSSYTISRPHPLLVQVRAEAFSALVVPARLWDAARDLLAPWTSRLASGTTRLLLLGEPEDPELHRAVAHGVAALLPAEPSGDALAIALAQAFESMELRERSESRGKWLSRYRYELGELIEIARAITTKREIHELLTVILEKSRFVTAADAGSVYVVEPGEDGGSTPLLRFKLSQNESMPFDSREFTIPLTRRSMAGYCALERRTVNIEDVYELPPDSPFGFDRSFDDRVGYRTRSVLATPLVSSKGEVIGVLQLLNRKRDPKARLTQPGHFAEQVVPFDPRSEQLLETLAAQAGIALENALLYDEIRGLFEGFVRASVDAIEARDPTTSGHSRRVAELTVGLAHAVERVTTGPYAEVRFAREDIRELQYASLLHDFGKIGVREHVLVKAKKLYPHQLDAIRLRLDFVIRTLERDRLARKIHAMERHATKADLEALDRDFEARRHELDTAWASIVQANEPTVLAAGDFQRITELASLTYTNPAGDTVALLGPDEVKALSIPRGSLTGEELDEIRSHVTHTHRFLSQIPW